MLIIFHNITVFTDQINAALVSRRDFCQTHLRTSAQTFDV